MTDKTIDERRRAFTGYLYGLHNGLSSNNTAKTAECRRVLARLRRMFSGPRQEAEAYEHVFPHNPPRSEEEVWLLVAGLFALHPQARRPPSRRGSLGGSMAELEARGGFAATRRFIDLLGRDRDALPHYVRQAIRLLASHNITVNYDQLLDDLVVLLSDTNDDQARRVRLRWAREFHRQPARQGSTTDNTTTASGADATPASDDLAATENS